MPSRGTVILDTLIPVVAAAIAGATTPLAHGERHAGRDVRDAGWRGVRRRRHRAVARTPPPKQGNDAPTRAGTTRAHNPLR